MASIPSKPPPLTSRQLDNVLRVLEDCGRAVDLANFRHSAVEAMARHLDYHHTTFFVGATPELCFTDQHATGHGIPEPLIEPYVARYHHHDLFATPQALSAVRQYGAVSLDQLRRIAEREAPDRDISGYLERFLFRNSIYAKMAVRLRIAQTRTVIMGVVDPEPGAFGPVDLRLAELVGRHLGNLVRWHTGGTPPEPPDKLRLSARQAQVTALLARGFTNREIAGCLHIGVDTVKKHITQALSITGCQNRTQLALAWQTGLDQVISRPPD